MKRNRGSRVHAAFVAALFFVATAGLHALAEAVPPPTHRLPSGFITDWLICGPFPCSPTGEPKDNDHVRSFAGLEKDYLGEHGGETAIAPVAGMTHNTPYGKTVSWRPVAKPGAYIDFAAEFKPNENAVAYAACRLENDADRDVVLQVGSDDAVKVWIDGRLVHVNKVKRHAAPDQDFVVVSLSKGVHRCLVKVCQVGGEWGFYMQAQLLGGAAAKARLQFENTARLVTSPTLCQPGDLVSVSVCDVERARLFDVAYPVKYAAADAAGDRIAALSARTDAPAMFHTRTWPAGGYLLTAEIDPPGSGTIRLSRHIYLGDYAKAVDRFLREAPIAFPRRSRPAMTLDYCVKRLEALRDEGPGALESASDEVIEYFGWLRQFRAARDAEESFRDHLGSHVRGYSSQIDESTQYYSIYVPSNYYRGEPLSLVVSLHGYDAMNRPYAARNRQVRGRLRRLAEKYRYLILQPFGRGNTFYRGIGRIDVFRAIEEVCRDYDIDRDRIYLMGYSMGGSGTWAMGTFYADRFAAIAPVFGGPPYPLPLDMENEPAVSRLFRPHRVSPFDCAENLLHTPVFINHGDADNLVPVDYSRQMAFILQRLGYDVRYWEHPGKGHGGLAIENVLFDWFRRYERPEAPSRIRFKAGWLKHGRMYWLTVERFEHLGGFATVDARIAPGNLISIKSENVSVMSLSPPPQLIDAARPLDVVWNGRDAEVERVGDRLWRLVSPETPRDALTAPLRKKAGFEGPIDDVYTTPFIIVQGSQAPDPVMRAIVDAEARNLAESWRRWQHVTPRVKRDADVTLADMQSYNLIVVGGADENFIANKLLGELPVKVRRDSITFFDQTFRGSDLGLALIYPDPLAPKHYVYFVLGNSPAGLAGLSARVNGTYDFFISDGRTIGREFGDRTMVAAGRFDQQWQYRPQYVVNGKESSRRQVEVARRAPVYPNIAGAPATLYLSDLVPARQIGAFRDPGLDRTPYGERLRLGKKRRFRSNVHRKGIASSVPHGLNRVEYDLGGRYKRFRAIVGLQRPPDSKLTAVQRANTRVIFTVTGDGQTLWKSPPVTWDSPPIEADVKIEGVRVLGLSVSNAVPWHYRADSADWCEARIER